MRWGSGRSNTAIILPTSDQFPTVALRAEGNVRGEIRNFEQTLAVARLLETVQQVGRLTSPRLEGQESRVGRFQAGANLELVDQGARAQHIFKSGFFKCSAANQQQPGRPERCDGPAGS